MLPLRAGRGLVLRPSSSPCDGAVQIAEIEVAALPRLRDRSANIANSVTNLSSCFLLSPKGSRRVSIEFNRCADPLASSRGQPGLCGPVLQTRARFD
jgi:hypothetical protein